MPTNGQDKAADTPKAAVLATPSTRRFGFVHTALYAGVLYAVLIGLALFAPAAHAATVQGEYTINPATGEISNMNSSPQNTTIDPAVSARDLRIEKGTYPTIGTHLEGPNYNAAGAWTWSGLNGTTLGSYAAGDGDYFITVSATTSPQNTVVFCANLTSSVWSTENCVIPPEDGDDTTHIIQILDPTAGEVVASTTLPVSFNFVVSSTSPANAYEIRARKLLDPYGQTYVRGFLADEGWDTSLYGSSYVIDDEITVPYEGTYELSISLVDMSPDVPGSPIVPISSSVSVLVSAVEADFVVSTSTPGRVIEVFAAESCDLNLNPFEESTFNFGDCMGFLFAPGPEVWSKYSTLTLTDRFPFSYISQLVPIKDAIYGNANTSPSAISVSLAGFGEITFLSREMVAAVPFASLIKEMLSAVLWFLLAYSLYRIVIRSHDTQTHV